MPIKPENKHRYPKNWDWITARIRMRAGDRCECDGRCGKHGLHQCDRHNGDDYMLDDGGGTFPLFLEDGDEDLSSLVGKIKQEWSHDQNRWIQTHDPATYVHVVLTVAHLDHTPENCDFSNLMAMCQRCHLAYDATHHAQTRYNTKREGLASADLFAISTQPAPAPVAGFLPGVPNDHKRIAALPMLQAGQSAEDQSDIDRSEREQRPPDSET